MSTASVMEVNADDWDEKVLKSKTLIVVDFWHERCPWCKMLEPVYAETAKEYGDKLKFAKFNVLANEENQHVALKYGIMSTPTLMFFCDGRPVQGIAGFMPKEQLKKLIEDVMGKHLECLEKSTELSGSGAKSG